MIRTGYLRWEIEAEDRLCEQDRMAREIVFRARPTHRHVRIRAPGLAAESAVDSFLKGRGNYAAVKRAEKADPITTAHVVADVEPHEFRYSYRERYDTPAFWMSKLKSEARTFGHQVVRAAASVPQLVVATEPVRVEYARLVAWEALQVAQGKSQPQPTNETDAILIEVPVRSRKGIPELVAAELVRDVLEPREFREFCDHNRVTIQNDGKVFRIPRQTHGMVTVWDAKTKQCQCRLCIVFEDPGLPPSDEVVMKYLLAKHQPQSLWKVGNSFPAANEPFPL